jgi:uncharacterized protein
MIYQRNITANILKSLKNNPVVLINGARQVGKSTLVESLITNSYKAHYISLDDHSALFASAHDPFGFLDKYDDPVAIDEIQRNTDLLMAIKRLVDSRKLDGQFLLTGSANILTIPKISESLAGRMIIHALWPLSQGEIRGLNETFIEWAFHSEKLPLITTKLKQSELIDMIVKGGYPRSLRAEDHADRVEWMRSYIDTILQRDVINLSKIEGLKKLPNVLAVLAERTGNLINLADIGRITGINKVTLKRYYTLLQMLFLIVEVPAWFTNREKRITKSPKIYLNDTGLSCYFKQLSQEDFMNNRAHIGQLLENFCLMELTKQASWQQIRPNIYHYRTQAGSEVDIVLEGQYQQIVGIEIKASTTIKKTDLSGLKSLKETAGDKFKKGIILYTGDQALALSDDIYALPVNSLWEL